jgi:hypothetical protein
VEGTQKKSNPVNDTQISDLYLPELRENKFLFLKKKKKKKSNVLIYKLESEASPDAASAAILIWNFPAFRN